MGRNGGPQPVQHVRHRTERRWAGWLYAADADTGVWKWRLKANYPIIGAMTPTTGGGVFFGDIGGNFYTLDSSSGHTLLARDLGGAIGGGVRPALRCLRGQRRL
jgi:alcohol dehydrogenase (cytochrome c)